LRSSRHGTRAGRPTWWQADLVADRRPRRPGLPLRPESEPQDIVFLIRTADVSDPDLAFLIDLYNAFGAVRTGAGDNFENAGAD
ncbi:MAG: hypothetical protein ABI968_09845, partial [Acidobacteriota bacterium]